MRDPKKLISIRIHPNMLKMADTFAALSPDDNHAHIHPCLDAPMTRSDVIRQALAIGLPQLIQGQPLQNKEAKSCRSSRTVPPKASVSRATA